MSFPNSTCLISVFNLSKGKWDEWLLLIGLLLVVKKVTPAESLIVKSEERFMLGLAANYCNSVVKSW